LGNAARGSTTPVKALQDIIRMYLRLFRNYYGEGIVMICPPQFFLGIMMLIS
jgi:hypothetical protein